MKCKIEGTDRPIDKQTVVDRHTDRWTDGQRRTETSRQGQMTITKTEERTRLSNTQIEKV